MQLLELQLFCMAREGRMTLQIPEILIGAPPESPSIEVKDSHLTRVGGFLYFSRAGYDFYCDRLREQFRDTGRGNWEEFEQAAENHFKDVILECDRKIASHRRAIAKLEARMRSNGR